MTFKCIGHGGLTRALRSKAQLGGHRQRLARIPQPSSAISDTRRQIRDALEGRVQAGLRVSRPADALEREADRTADAVMRMPLPNAAQAKAGGFPAPRSWRSGRVGLQSGGRPLSDAERAFFEPRFGRDFGNVRLHDDGRAEALADNLNARAFTDGNDIAFARGEYVAETDSGRRLLAHELAHVVQQRTGQASRSGLFRQPRKRTNWVLKRPPDIRQSGLTCWAAAMASWLLVKRIVETGFGSDFLLRHYRGTECTDDKDALVGDSNDDLEAVFAEWRILLDLDTEIAPDDFSLAMAKRLIENHGHFLLILHTSILHAMVVYGIEINPDNPADFSLLVMDPLSGYRTVTPWQVEQSMSIGVGMERSAGPAPCRSRKR